MGPSVLSNFGLARNVPMQMKHLILTLSLILGLATSVSSASVDYAIYVTDFSFSADETIYITDFSFSADEKWYLAGACEGANSNYSIRFTDFSFSADKKVYFTDFSFSADKSICFTNPSSIDEQTLREILN